MDVHYTNEQKLEIYSNVLEQLKYNLAKDYYGAGFCTCMHSAIRDFRGISYGYLDGFHAHDDIKDSLFSELIQYRPEVYVFEEIWGTEVLYWFPRNEEGLKRRIEITKEIIVKLQNNINGRLGKEA